MFQNVLVAEDFDTINIAIKQALDELGIVHTQHSAYCDEAFLKLRKGLQDNAPCDLLVSDLSFNPGMHVSQIENGVELIRQAKKLDPQLKVVVFSIENRLQVIKTLWEELEVDAFILKGRNNIPELKKTIKTVFEGGRYLSQELAALVQNKALDEIESYDLDLMRMLADGMNQKDIVAHLKAQDITPNSESSVEKRLAKLRTALGANTNVQLLLFAKDLGLV